MIKNLSVVIPVWNEEKNVRPLFKELAGCLEKINLKDYEVIFVDDGSTDRTPANLKKIRHQKLKVISLQGHEGKGLALQAGFKNAVFPFILTMDGDSQDDPKEIASFVKKIAEGYDLVVGWKHKRKDPGTKIIASRIANFIAGKIIGLKIHDMDCGYKLFRKKLIKNIPLHGDLYRFIPPLAASCGYRVAEIKVNHRKRKYGSSKYGWRRLVSASLDFVSVIFLTKYLHHSLHFFGIIGLITSFLGSLILAYLTIIKISGESIGQRPLLSLGVLMVLMGIQFLVFGLLSELIIMQGNQQKKFLIRKIWKSSKQ